MKLLKRWKRDEGSEREHHAGGGSAIVRRRHGRDQPLGVRRLESTFEEVRSAIDRAFDRMWREFDRGHAPLGESVSPITPITPITGDWPAIDLAEDEKGITLRVDVPGMEAKDVDVEISGNRLTLRGNRQEEWSDRKPGLVRHERRTGSFVRSITLPSYIEADQLEAKFENGVLTLTAPRNPEKAPKRVNVTG